MLIKQGCTNISETPCSQFFQICTQKWNCWVTGCCCCCCSVVQSCPTLGDTMGCSTPGFPVLHHLPELAQTQLHQVSNIIQPLHPLSSPSPQSFPALGSFLMSRLFKLGGQSIRGSASASVLPMNIQDWFPLGLTGLISLQSKGTLKSLLQNHSAKAWILWRSTFFMVQLAHLYRTTGKTIALTIRIFVGKVMSLHVNTLKHSKIAT